MSFLTPLYVLGLAVISLPILLHLIRRTPKGMQPFSSLMFVAPTPPRLTRRSRLDQLLLLLLRAAIIGLLAFAFARPFFRHAASASLTDLSGRFVAVLIDTSGSMRRNGIWEQVGLELDRVLADLGPTDRIALYRFSNQSESVVSFDESQSVAAPARRDLVESRFRQLQPGWGESSLGDAMILVADDLDALEDEEATVPTRQLVVISDLQQGSLIDSMQGYQWPESIQAVLRRIEAVGSTNASLHLLQSATQSDDSRGVRVRVSNAADSLGQQFEVCWAGAESNELGSRIGVSVPPGESRVVRIPPLPAGQNATHLLLTGDDHDYDNRYYVAPSRKIEGTVLYVGDASDGDPEQMLYYLQRALTNDKWQDMKIVQQSNASITELPDGMPLMVVVAQEMDPASRDQVRQYIQGGGTALMILTSSASAETLEALTGEAVELLEDTQPDDYVLWSDIDFGHPLFEPFAHPLYNDFSKIHFWKYRRLVTAPTAKLQTLVQFDSGDPALLHCTIGNGEMYVLTASWRPEESQLARSSKFVPLLNRMINHHAPTYGVRYVVDRPISRLARTSDREIIVTKPDGSQVPLPIGQTEFDSVDQPGLYRLDAGDEEQTFAVNLATWETQTGPLDIAQLEQRGVRLGQGTTRSEELEALRQMRDVELEERQSAWQWLIAAALLLLIAETFIAGRWSKRLPSSEFAANVNIA